MLMPTTIVPNDLATVERQGAMARACGEALTANPYALQEMAEAVTGRTTMDWQVLVYAWEMGWLGEEARRQLFLQVG